jgi:hypothetical protein
VDGQFTEKLTMNDSGMGILGVIIGAMLVIGILVFAFGERLGVRGPSTTVKVEAPKVPAPTPSK